jgi:hypothetical protein
MRLQKSFLFALVLLTSLFISAFADPAPPQTESNFQNQPFAEIKFSAEKAPGIAAYNIFSNVQAINQPAAFAYTTTAYRDHVYKTDAGNLIERISLGLAAANPFYKYRKFGNSARAIYEERKLSILERAALRSRAPNLRPAA